MAIDVVAMQAVNFFSKLNDIFLGYPKIGFTDNKNN